LDFLFKDRTLFCPYNKNIIRFDINIRGGYFDSKQFNYRRKR